MSNDMPSIGASEQSAKAYCDRVIYSYASMFRAFCEQEGVTRAEALELTKAIVSARETAAIVAQRKAGES